MIFNILEKGYYISEHVDYIRYFFSMVFKKKKLKHEVSYLDTFFEASGDSATLQAMLNNLHHDPTGSKNTLFILSKINYIFRNHLV